MFNVMQGLCQTEGDNSITGWHSRNLQVERGMRDRRVIPGTHLLLLLHEKHTMSLTHNGSSAALQSKRHNKQRHGVWLAAGTRLNMWGVML